MAFTDNCDLFASVHEDGVNRVIDHIVRQRPSLFNYATADVAANRELWCNSPEFTRDVTKYGNPIFKIQQPLPLLGSDSPTVVIGYCAQLSKVALDFHPGNVVGLPPQLNPPLKDQRFALRFRVCGGLVCPTDREVLQVPVGSPEPKERPRPVPPVQLRGRPNCFCVDVFAVGRFERTPNDLLLGVLEGVEVVDVKPDGLEANIECYVKTAVNVALRQKLVVAIKKLTLSFPLLDLATVTLFPTPNPPVPNNPAVEQDQLKVFITMTA